MKLSIKKTPFYVGLLILGATLLGLWIGNNQHTKTPLIQIVNDEVILRGREDIGGTFTLIDQNGQIRTDHEFRGKPMLVYFGYTYCPDICPMGLSAISIATADMGGANIIQPLFITIDPERDTVNQIKQYAGTFGDDLILLTGEKHQIEAAMKAYNVYGEKITESRAEEQYLMDHSSIIYLMDQNGNFVKHFSHFTPPELIVKSIQKLLEPELNTAF